MSEIVSATNTAPVRPAAHKTASRHEKTLPVHPKSVVWNPTPEQLRAFAAEMPNARETEFGNLNVATRVVSRSKLSTFIATDTPEQHSDQTISREEYARVAKLQDDYIATRDMLVIEGYIGNDPEFRVPARLIIEKSNANIAAMQHILYYPATPAEIAEFEPALTVIYTPNLKADGYPDERLIAVDLEHYTTRVFNSDYFGESKKGGLRMWNKLVYERGGLALHAGCKVIPVDGQQRVGLIVGLSGTGKTTTTFTKQNNSQPVQDDFCALMPGGKIYATENGCFAKTFGLNPNDEPTIYHACASTHAYLENVSQNEEGKIDYFDTSYTPNGRAVIRMDDIAGAADAREVNNVDFLLILNRNENIIPAVAKLEGPLAAAYFMLGETKGTSAGGAAEAGKSLRVPGTNPFFPLLHAYQGNRMNQLMKDSPMEVYLMNTGAIGGDGKQEGSKKVKIQHSSAVVKAIAEGTIKWEQDPDFGYLVATEVPGIDDPDYLQPKKMYERQGRLDEYNALVEKYNKDRRDYLRKWKGLDEEIVNAI
ncbi:MAG: phosphoenolpyruvate carboxykinase [Acidobacteria bacterium]|nr:phosphoenolpyruvate carboxykinase [Acidobacteriota bacterium]MBV9474586.1 phosphoenolpyruvate carboxykinase [Acidobacteriota bacterium]